MLSLFETAINDVDVVAILRLALPGGSFLVVRAAVAIPDLGVLNQVVKEKMDVYE